MFTPKEIEIQKKKDKIEVAKLWKDLEDDATKKSDPATAKRIVAALQDYYKDMYEDIDLISWIANLYDPVTGGFYYSNSSRDNDGYLPDLESTFQAIVVLMAMGIQDEFREAKDICPEWMQKQIIKFVKERQDKNGYFYHPQWPRELTDSKPHRRGRDLTWACEILRWFGEAPTYDTPNGVRGNGLLWDGAPADDFTSSENIGVTGTKEELVSPHLKDKESFEKYLNDLYEEYKPLGPNCWYPIGNRLESEGPQIVRRDNALKARGADYSLCDIMAEWMTKAQNPKNGLWVDDDLDGEYGKSGTNALLKIGSAYNKIQRPIPKIDLCFKATIDISNGDLPILSVCSVLNPFYAMSVLRSNLHKYNADCYEEKARIESEHIKYMYEHAPEIIEITKKRIIIFKKPDGGFSYTPECSSWTSQGHPVALPDSAEGDLNATNIAAAAVIGHIFTNLNLKRIPVFTLADKMRFLNIVEENKKQSAEID